MSTFNERIIMKLTGQQRLQITLVWIKQGKPMPLQDFIKKVCEAKGLEYTEPPKIERPVYK
jgi:hypothetical protein